MAEDQKAEIWNEIKDILGLKPEDDLDSTMTQFITMINSGKDPQDLDEKGLQDTLRKLQFMAGRITPEEAGIVTVSFVPDSDEPVFDTPEQDGPTFH